MNLLSLMAFTNACSFVQIGIYFLILNRKAIENRLFSAIIFCLAIWNFTYTFFYSAVTAEEAMFWHKAGSFGWIMFCVLGLSSSTDYAGIGKEGKSKRWHFLWYILPFMLLFKALFSKETPLAKGVQQSKIGWGWTYQLNVGSIWFWLYVVYVVGYLMISLYSILNSIKKSGNLRIQKQVKSIVMLDVIMIVIGFFTDFFLPATSLMPPFFNLISIIWGVGLLCVIKNYKFMTVYDVASSDLILKTVMNPIILLDKQGVIIKCNQATEKLLNYPAEQILNRPLADFCHSKEDASEKLNMVSKEKDVQNVELDLQDSEGNIIQGLASFSVAVDKLDGPVGIVLNIQDVTRLKNIEKELSKRTEKYKELSKYLDRQANYDELTGLPNRRMFFKKLNSAIENCREAEDHFALIYFDLDGFKKVNDSYGHDIGDLVLEKASKMFVASIRKEDFIARIGGDEFVIISYGLQKDLELDHFLKRMKDLFEKPMVVNDCICSVGVSLGVSKYPEDGTTIDELIKVSDERMYVDKNRGKRLRSG